MERGTAWGPLAGLLIAVLVLGTARAEEEPKAPAATKPDALVFGTYAVTTEQVVDGDTIRITDQPSVRILCLDTEEVFRRPADREAAEANFQSYARAKRGDSPRPAKYGTPAGEAAKAYARKLIGESTRVRLERDRLGAPEIDPYGRRLAHVVLETKTGDVLFAEAMIRAGHSPYFIKYGGSIRFDTQLRAAERAAREAKRGIWSEKGPDHYPDYEERLRWWNERLKQVRAWREVAARSDHVTLGEPGATKKLEGLVGNTAVVRGLFSRALETKDKTKMIIFLGDRPRQGFPLVFFDRDVYAALDLPAIESMYVTVTGKISLYRGRPQMVVERADQISTR